MSYISFGLTLKELLAGIKWVTRRSWTQKRHNEEVNNWNNSRLIHDAYDKNPRNGGIIIGAYELTCRPYLEALRDMPKHEFAAEGGMVDNLKDFCELIERNPSDVVSVIRFKFTPNEMLECPDNCLRLMDVCGEFNKYLKTKTIYYRCDQCVKEKYIK